MMTQLTQIKKFTRDVKDSVDILQGLTTAGLDAAGIGWASTIWESFFPGEEVFSESQLQQLTQLFQELLQQQYFQQNLDNFESTAQLVGQYANDNNDGVLPLLLEQTADCVAGILSNGYTSVRVYVAAAALQMTALKFQYEASPSDGKSGAAKNIASAALSALTDLADLEQQYLDATDWVTFCNFKTSTITGYGSIPSSAVEAFGADYYTNVQSLLNLLSIYGPIAGEDFLNQVVYVPYLLYFQTANLANPFWTATNNLAGLGETVQMYQVSSDATLPADVYPLGDQIVFTGAFPEYNPAYTVYFQPYTALALTPPSWTQIYNDSGSGNTNDFAVFSPSGSAAGIGAFSADNDGASQPDNANIALMIDPQYYVAMQTSGVWAWEDVGTGADMNVTLFDHPQFGGNGLNCGLYNAYPGYPNPLSMNVNGLNPSAILGHPSYVAPSSSASTW